MGILNDVIAANRELLDSGVRASDLVASADAVQRAHDEARRRGFVIGARVRVNLREPGIPGTIIRYNEARGFGMIVPGDAAPVIVARDDGETFEYSLGQLTLIG